MTDHDRVFKELLTTFFVEFLELFLPDVARRIDRESIAFLPQEYFADLTTGDTKIVDLLAQVHLAGEEAGFLIHVENQSSSESDFSRRMFFYFARSLSTLDLIGNKENETQTGTPFRRFHLGNC
jgi:predicted transposase/invertase (TIGR01784 family)